MKTMLSVFAVMLAGCSSATLDKLLVQPDTQVEQIEYIIIELPPEELKKTCGLWSGTSGCVWLNHKFILKREGAAL